MTSAELVPRLHVQQRSGPLDDVRLHVVDSIDELLDCRRWLGERRAILGVDTESGGLNPFQHRERMIQIGDLRHGWSFPASRWAGAAAELLSGYRGRLVAHNSPYDWRVLKIHNNIELPWPDLEDTLLGGRIIDSSKPAALKPRCALDVDPRAVSGQQAMDAGMKANGWDYDTVPDTWLPYLLYGAADPVEACFLWDRFAPGLEGEFAPSYALEKVTARICAGMMLAGMRIDREYIGAQIASMTAWCDQAMAYFRHAYGISSVNSADQIEWMLNRMGIACTIRTGTGQPSFAKDTLRWYASQNPDRYQEIMALQKCRKLSAVVDRYLRKFLRLADGDIMHYQIWTSEADTGRMSVTEPPMQTYDREEPAVRGSYVPRPGYVFVTVDADQIEARMAAHLSRDPNLIADLNEADAAGLKFFVVQASKIFAEEISTKDPRYTQTKNAFYGQQFGAGLAKAALVAGVPVRQMAPVYNGIVSRYRVRGAYMERQVREAKHGGGRPQVRTIGGRRLFAPRGREYALFNYQVQGSAAEALKQGLADVDAAGYGHLLRLPVHDEILMEVPREDARAVLHDVTRILTNTTDYVVPITWSGSILEERWRKT